MANQLEVTKVNLEMDHALSSHLGRFKCFSLRLSL